MKVSQKLTELVPTECNLGNLDWGGADRTLGPGISNDGTF